MQVRKVIYSFRKLRTAETKLNLSCTLRKITQVFSFAKNILNMGGYNVR